MVRVSSAWANHEGHVPIWPFFQSSLIHNLLLFLTATQGRLGSGCAIVARSLDTCSILCRLAEGKLSGQACSMQEKAKGALVRCEFAHLADGQQGVQAAWGQPISEAQRWTVVWNEAKQQHQSKTLKNNLVTLCD